MMIRCTHTHWLALAILLMLVFVIPWRRWAIRHAKRPAWHWVFQPIGVPWPAWSQLRAAAEATRRPSMPRWWGTWNHSSLARRCAIVALVLALAQPQLLGGWRHVSRQGIALMLALDVSSSMRQQADNSTKETRLDQAKAAIRRFLALRPQDAVGLTIFANYPDVTCPLTLDHDFLQALLDAVTPALPAEDGTNLGDALVWALEPLHQEGNTRARVLVVLTDGRNNPAVAQPTAPITAARLARQLGITVHFIALTSDAIGTTSNNPESELISTWAKEGGGQVFPLEQMDSLAPQIAAIANDAQIRWEQSLPVAATPLAPWCVIAALAALTYEQVLRRTPWRAHP